MLNPATRESRLRVLELKIIDTAGYRVGEGERREDSPPARTREYPDNEADLEKQRGYFRGKEKEEPTTTGDYGAAARPVEFHGEFSSPRAARPRGFMILFLRR